MYFKQFYLGCLAHASYLIGSEGEAVVVDPQRDVEQYLAEAEAQNLKIKYVIETHVHADFVSGHQELAARTGAQIVFGQRAGATFAHVAARDGDEFLVGNVSLRILETPGHTPEGISILVNDMSQPTAPIKALTGDTLFIGDVGRPDLAGGKGFTAEQMAGMLYDSLHEKLLSLDDTVEVYPAHGAGSLCGKNLSKESWSTIGQQRQFNYALQPMTKEAFVQMMTTDLPEVPAYFPKDAEINRSGVAVLTGLSRPTALTAVEFKTRMQTDGLVLDVRPSEAFGASHVPGALNIGLGGQFASWAGTLIPMGTPIWLVAEDESQVDEVVTRLARVGIETVQGYLDGGMAVWTEPIESIPQISVAELKDLIEVKPNLQVIDVRRPTEYNAGHVPHAINAQLASLENHLAQFDPQRETAVLCAGGYRSSVATSILEKHGFGKLLNVKGGTGAWVNAGYPVYEVDSINSTPAKAENRLCEL